MIHNLIRRAATTRTKPLLPLKNCSSPKHFSHHHLSQQQQQSTTTNKQTQENEAETEKPQQFNTVFIEQMREASR